MRSCAHKVPTVMLMQYIKFQDPSSQVEKSDKNLIDHNVKTTCISTDHETRAGVCKTLCPQLPDSNTA